MDQTPIPSRYQRPVLVDFSHPHRQVAQGMITCMNGPRNTTENCINGSANMTDCRYGCTANARCETGEGVWLGYWANQCCTGDTVAPYNCTNGNMATANCLTGDAGVLSMGCEEYTCLQHTGCSTGS